MTARITDAGLASIRDQLAAMDLRSDVIPSAMMAALAMTIEERAEAGESLSAEIAGRYTADGVPAFVTVAADHVEMLAARFASTADGIDHITDRLGDMGSRDDGELVWHYLRSRGVITHDGREFVLPDVDLLAAYEAATRG